MLLLTCPPNYRNSRPAIPTCSRTHAAAGADSRGWGRSWTELQGTKQIEVFKQGFFRQNYGAR